MGSCPSCFLWPSEALIPSQHSADERNGTSVLAGLVRLAALACKAPMAALAVRDGTGWRLHAQIGLASWEPGRLPLGHAVELICAVPGGANDARFYAGMPVEAPGCAQATLFVLDREERPAALSPDQREMLHLLAGQAAALLAAAVDRRDAALYCEIFQAAPVDLVLIDVDADETFRYADLNRAHIRNSGFVGDRFIGRSPEDVFNPEAAAAARALYREVLETGRTLEYERRLTFPSGDRVRHSTMVPLMDHGGRIAKILLGSIDLTEMRRVEAQLRQAQKTEALGQLTSGIAHDFNNLLAAVIGSLELLRPKLEHESAHRLLEIAVRAAGRGSQLTRQLLAFARKQHLTPRPVAVAALLSGLNEMLQRTLGGMVQVDMVLAEDLWPALADPTQLEQMVLNLAINARDAMPNGGRVRIAAGNVTIDADDPGPGDYVRLTVADAGHGMSPEVVQKAFDPFFTTKPMGKGSGLGLSQVYGVARQFGGTVRIESRVGVGTSVEVLLPRARDVPVEIGSGAEPAAIVAGATLLVVDDELDVLEVIAETLSAAGYDVSRASNAAEALAAISATAFDALLLDYALPGMSGAEVARRARILRPDLPIVFVTGYADALPADGPADMEVVSKPFSRDELLAGLGRALQGRSRP
jgi:PAS domain S-box-containing protein